MVNESRLLGIDLRPAFWPPPLHGREMSVGPGQTFFVWQAALQGQDLLVHLKGRCLVILGVFEGLACDFDEPISVVGDVIGFPFIAVVDAIEIAACALGHGTNRAFSIDGQSLCQAVCEETEVVGRAATSVVVHGKVGQDGEGTPV